MTTATAIRVGSRWAAVVEYDGHGEAGRRQGYWCVDARGGWGTSSRSAQGAVDACAHARVYRTRREALESVAYEVEHM